MKLKKRWLSAALVFQVVVSVFLMWRANAPVGANSLEPLLDFSWEDVDRVLIDDGETQLTMIHQNQQWYLNNDTGLPVDADKMNRLMTEVSDFKLGIPVVTQRSSFERFEVDDEAFYRHVELYQGDQVVAAFYVGSTPAMNQSYIRVDDGADVYALGFNRYQLSVSTNGWLDKGLLKADAITEIEHENWRAEKGDNGWHLTQFNNEPLDSELAPEALTSLVQSLEQMQVTGKALDVDKANLQLIDTYTVVGEQRWVYTFYQLKDEKFVTRSDVESVFKLTNHIFDQVASLDFSDAVVAASDQEQNEDPVVPPEGG